MRSPDQGVHSHVPSKVLSARNWEDLSAKWANQRKVLKREYEDKWREAELRAAAGTGRPQLSRFLRLPDSLRSSRR